MPLARPFRAPHAARGPRAALVARGKLHASVSKPASRAQGKPEEPRQPKGGRRKQGGSGGGSSIWRVFNVDVPLEDDPGKSHTGVHDSLLAALQAKLRGAQRKGPKAAAKGSAKGSLSIDAEDVRVVRKSLDARLKRRGVQDAQPRFTYVVDVQLSKAASQRLRSVQGQQERIQRGNSFFSTAAPRVASPPPADAASPDAPRKTVLVVGAGPAGYFAALALCAAGVRAVVVERGRGVEQRGKDIGALFHRGVLNAESNVCFGEGGAGTWSDGKLTTRIGRNGDDVRTVLETLVAFGAPEDILVNGKPHLGTDRLVRILRSAREALQSGGGAVLFGTKCTEVVFSGGAATGAVVCDAESGGDARFLGADAVVLAPGHSARELYAQLRGAGVAMERKGFAVGFRVEHPQSLINAIQYREFARLVRTGRPSTDRENAERNGGGDAALSGRLPVADYRLAHTSGATERGAFSFCMCPGGQIVPTSTEEGELCINGMSFSRRDSKWANSALVVTVGEDGDAVLDAFEGDDAVLAGVAFQRHCERRAAQMGGGNFVAPVQRVTDFLEGRLSDSLPSSSYRMGVKSAPLHELYPPPLTEALREALRTNFEASMPGFISEDALLHGVETRTSAPVRIVRDAETLEADGVRMLFPAGEGAGYAGGIVSAAVDGLRVARAVLAAVGAEAEAPGA